MLRWSAMACQQVNVAVCMPSFPQSPCVIPNQVAVPALSGAAGCCSILPTALLVRPNQGSQDASSWDKLTAWCGQTTPLHTIAPGTVQAALRTCGPQAAPPHYLVTIIHRWWNHLWAFGMQPVHSVWPRTACKHHTCSPRTQSWWTTSLY